MLVLCLQTIKRNEPAPHSDAFIGHRLLSLPLHGRSTALHCPITTVQRVAAHFAIHVALSTVLKH